MGHRGDNVREEKIGSKCDKNLDMEKNRKLSDGVACRKILVEIFSSNFSSLVY